MKMAKRLPTGTVTFLFTDVEGSTRLLDAIGPGAYKDALSEHRRVLRDAFERHGGAEVDTQGDSFFVAFARASDAVAAAAEAQGALRDGVVAVRMGVHTGEPLLADRAYFGIDVHRAARLAAAGSGGQVLLSRATRDLADAEVTDLGDHRLKDLLAPERIYQLGRGEFPRLKTLYQTNLPVQTTPLVGRKRELDDVVSLLGGSTRLLTLTGVGGSGKTRLALHAAAEVGDLFPDGVWFVPLAPLSDPTLVASTIAHVLDADGDLGGYLRDRRLMLVLDNFEQVLDAAPDVGAVLAHAPNVRVLVTSRERLHLSVEHEYEVPVLGIADAAALFVERARRFDARVEPSDEVRELVAAVDCLPLAIELAAARIKVLSPAEMRDRLGRGLDLLTGGDRDIPERQRTLRATIEWSYELLEPSARMAFAALSVFPSTFSADAAERVAAADIDRLASLVDKSLLRHTSSGRFFMLATIREYARARLDAGPEARRVREEHASHYLAFAEEHRVEIEKTESLDRVELEHDNFRAALSWFEASGNGECELKLAAALGWFWFAHGHLVEGRRHLEHATAHGKAEAPRARALRFLAALTDTQGDHVAAAAAAAESVSLYEALDDETGLARAVLANANIAMSRGDRVAAQAGYASAAELFRRVGDPHAVAVAAGSLAYHALVDEDEKALELSEAAVIAAREAGATAIEATSLLNVAFAHVQHGNADEAVAVTRDAARIAASLGLTVALSYCIEAIGAAAAARGDGETAARLLAAADAARSAIGAALDPFEARIDEEARRRARASVSDERFAAAWDAGSALTLDDAVADALDLALAQRPAPD
jgi:predicted ATPase/class 3 adenylate cyclase